MGLIGAVLHEHGRGIPPTAVSNSFDCIHFGRVASDFAVPSLYTRA